MSTKSHGTPVLHPAVEERNKKLMVALACNGMSAHIGNISTSGSPPIRPSFFFVVFTPSIPGDFIRGDARGYQQLVCDGGARAPSNSRTVRGA